jgi:hypothetical protein
VERYIALIILISLTKIALLQAAQFLHKVSLPSPPNLTILPIGSKQRATLQSLSHIKRAKGDEPRCNKEANE